MTTKRKPRRQVNAKGTRMADVLTRTMARRGHRPCLLAIDWLKHQTTPEQAWKKCERPDWMLWFLYRMASSDNVAEQKKLIACRLSIVEACFKKMKHKPARRLADRMAKTIRSWTNGRGKNTTIQRVARTVDATACDLFLKDKTSSIILETLHDLALSTITKCETYDTAIQVIKIFLGPVKENNRTNREKRWLAVQQRIANIIRRHYPNPPYMWLFSV